MPNVRFRIERGIDDRVVTLESPDWFLAFIVDVHRIVDELHAINKTLMRIAERDLAQQRVSGVRKP